MTNPKQRLLAQIDQQIAAVGESMAAQMNNQSLCQIQKDGRITGGIKYDEGRLETLHTLRRIVTDNVDFSPELLYAELLRREAQLEKFVSQDRPSIQWVAYGQGGADVARKLYALINQEEAP